MTFKGILDSSPEEMSQEINADIKERVEEVIKSRVRTPEPTKETEQGE